MSAVRDRYGMAGLGAVALLLTIAVTLFWYLGFAQKLFEGKGRAVYAEMADAQQLVPGDDVRVDGRKEGKVQDVRQEQGGRSTKVEFDVDESAGPIYRDASVELRWKNLLGGSFYLELRRGTPQAGVMGEGETIPRSRVRTQVELEDVTSVFQGGARRGLKVMPDELSKALRDPSTLSTLLDTAADASPSLERGLNAVRGQDQDVDLRRVLTGTASAMAALDAPRDELNRLVEGAAGTLAVTAARADDIRTTLAAGPQVTAQVRTTLARLDGTLDKADRLVGKLDRSAGQVGPTLAALRPVLGDTDELLDDARPLVRQLRPTTTSLAGLSERGIPLLDALQPSLDRLDDTILPFLARKDPHTDKPTSVMIGGTAAGFGGSAGQRDANGHFIRFPASSGLSSPAVYFPCRSSTIDPTVAQLAACDSLDKALNTYLGYLPRLSATPAGGGSR